MTCNCGNEKVVVRHVRGNTLTLAIPLQERIRRMVDNEETVETVDYNPLPTDVVTVNLRGFTRTVTFSGTDVTITGNVIEVTDKGTLGVGTYGVEILIDSADGKKRRYYSASEIQVVEQTRDAGIDEGTEYDVTTRTLEAAVFDIMRGYSAYEIWIQQGHEGTEADFLEWLRDDSMAGEYVDNAETLIFYHPEWGACNILKNPVKTLGIVTEGISETGAARSTLIFRAAANLNLSVASANHVSTIQQGSPKFIEGNCYVMHFVGVRNEDDATTHVVCWFDSKLTTVAYTGSYNDLEDKPTIPVLPALATVATSGLWSDLTGRPMKGVYAYTEMDSLKDEGWYGIERADGDSANYSTKYPMELLLVTFDQFKGGTNVLNLVTQTLICWDGHIRQRKWNRNAWGAWVDVLSTAAYSGSYTDLTDKPTIPDTSTFVPTSRKVNGKALTGDIALDANDVGALPASTPIPGINGKADKVESATNGHLAGLNASGNLTDSGIVPSTLVYQGAEIGSTPSVDFDAEADTVHVTAQTLSAAQKQQVRENIGAGTSSFSGSYNDLADKPTIPDASNFVQKSQTSGLLKNDGTVDTNTYMTSAPVTSVNGQTGAVTISTGDANVIESISINGTTQTVTSKNVNLPVPTSTAVTQIVSISQSAYDALATKDTSTLYLITS